MKTSIAKFIGTSFGFGFIPWAPGTWGAAFGVAIYYLLHIMVPDQTNAWLIGLAVVFTIIGTWCCEVLAKEWGDDPSRIVMDESVGIWITFIAVPFTWPHAVLGFALFRFFDILKPLGIKTIDTKVKNGFGVMLDDILAAVYSWIVLQGIIHSGILENFM